MQIIMQAIPEAITHHRFKGDHPERFQRELQVLQRQSYKVVQVKYISEFNILTHNFTSKDNKRML